MKLNQSQLKADQDKQTLPVGDYVYEVIAAKESPSAKSSDGKKTELKLRIVDATGRKHTVKDYLGLWPYGSLKVKSFMDSTGLDPDEDHDVNDLIGLTGNVRTKKGEFNGIPKAEVAFYIPLAPGATPPVLPTQEDEDEFSSEPASDEELPF